MRYYGSKEKLLSYLEGAVEHIKLFEGAKFVDLFTGTTTVAQHFKKLGFTVVANDNLEFCYSLAKTYIELNDYPKFYKLRKHLNITNKDSAFIEIINYLNNLKVKSSFITKNYCPSGKLKRKYFSDSNGQKIDTIRTQIENWKDEGLVSELEFYYLLTSLLEAVNLVSNVPGTYGAYLKKWDKRALKELILVPPTIIPSNKENKAFKKDANELVKEINADIIYLDPPYNSRQYVSNYFLLELIAVGWFKRKIIPQGVTGIIIDEEKKSKYSQKTFLKDTFVDLINHIKSRHILLSYNNEGFLSEGEIRSVLETYGEVVLNGNYLHKRYRSINQTEEDPTTVNEMLFLVKKNNIKERFNNLGGRAWLQNSFSIWKDIRKNSEELKLKHPAMFPISLVDKIIDSYSNNTHKLVFDPFAGSGSTIISALKHNLNSIGIDLNRNYINMIKSRLKNTYSNFDDKSKYKLFVDDSIMLDKYLEPNSVDICITSPPYWDILNSIRSADNKEIRKYSDHKRDLGNVHDYQLFIDSIENIFSKTYKVMKKNGFCFVVVMDIRKKSDFYPFHIDTVAVMKKIGFSIRDIIIWDRQVEYNNMKPLGYPYSFIVNKVHEYILIFEK